MRQEGLDLSSSAEFDDGYIPDNSNRILDIEVVVL